VSSGNAAWPAKYKTPKRRTRLELILMILSGIVVSGLIPFIFIRLSAEQWSHGIFNISLLLVFVYNGVYVYRTRKTRIPRLIFALAVVFAMFLGFYLKGEGEIPWSYPGLVSLFFAVRPRLAAFFCSLCIIWAAVWLFPIMDLFEYITYIITLSFTCLAVYFFASITRKQRIALTKLSRTDSLTGLLNRRAFDEKLDEQIGLIRECQENSLILFDIDHFKRFNDEHGHSAGDRVLREISSLITQRMRRSDRVYRIGGEEFALVLTCTVLSDAIIVAESVRTLIAEANILQGYRVTVSLGVTEYCENESKDSWFKRCDNALYKAKDCGRNRVETAQ
jgi:diguanylate cyclase (GGDEF)-like protein